MFVLYTLVQVETVQNVQKLWLILGPLTTVLGKQDAKAAKSKKIHKLHFT